ncbi:N-acetylmuramic acid 6-phosphate etherase [Botrimarina hoheduenensis]|uniref:N-acetylmuramic acid 6-phosphate etherase n=1 Tax=Botrimarina hoheduenensis TaxID=2528000 RepID=A0A5C5WGC1_9BACT|nr:N-acetylmuramic acid 6-phosphate etherase [Botrimarina hoheduenensis]TWT48832.1 N-acetylmuramic acid 6-phosphate etherase [Botrimarina hoheduenensis]
MSNIALDHLTTEARNPATMGLDGVSPLEMVRLINAEDHHVAEAVGSESEAIAQAVEVVADRLRRGGRLVYTGAGTSGRLGVLDAAECPPTFNTDPRQVVGIIAGGRTALTNAVEGAEDSPELGAEDLKAINLGPDDVLVGIATSGRTPYVVGGLKYARQVGAFSVALSCNAAAEIIPLADLSITPIVGPEVLSGSTRLKAGTATKLVLNTITTAAMVLLGKTYGNLMVDLRPTNSKLEARAKRIVRLATGVEPEVAAELLARCDGDVKVAIVAQLTGSTPAEAKSRLVETGGRVGVAVAR